MLILYAIFLKKSTKIGFTRKNATCISTSRAPHTVALFALGLMPTLYI